MQFPENPDSDKQLILQLRVTACSLHGFADVLKLPKTVVKVLNVGPMNGSKYHYTPTAEYYDIGFLHARQEGDELSAIYRLDDRWQDGDVEYQSFEFDRSMPYEEALGFIQRESAHHRN